MNTSASSIKDKSKGAIYNCWQNSGIITASLDTLPIRMQGATQKTTYSEPLWIPRLANEWKLIENEVLSLLYTDDVLNFCSKYNLLKECDKYYKYFIETFHNIRDIRVSVSEDHEIPDYRKLSFILTISDSIENVLKHENEFRNKIRKEILKEKRQHFVYNYNLT